MRGHRLAGRLGRLRVRRRRRRRGHAGFAPAHLAAALGRRTRSRSSRAGVHCERLHRNGFTLSLFAARAGHLEALQVLVKHGADARRPCFIDHELVAGRRVQTTLMQVALYDGRDAVATYLRDECGVGRWESELVVVDEGHGARDAAAAGGRGGVPRRGAGAAGARAAAAAGPRRRLGSTRRGRRAGFPACGRRRRRPRRRRGVTCLASCSRETAFFVDTRLKR